MLVKPGKSKPKTLKDRAIIWSDFAVFLSMILGAILIYNKITKIPDVPKTINNYNYYQK